MMCWWQKRLLVAMVLCETTVSAFTSLIKTNFKHFTVQQEPNPLVLSLSLYEEEERTTRRSRRIRPMRPNSVNQQEAEKQRVAEQAQREARQLAALQDPTLLSQTKFNDIPGLDKRLARALTDQMGFEKMTDIQAKTYALILNGSNVVGQARTGTGKTLAFLVPILQQLLQGETTYMAGRNIGALIVAPTRELAQQIASEAELLLTHVNTENISVQCCFGGTKMSRDINALRKRLPTLLVATPGRLKDHLVQKTNIKGRKFASILRETSICVLDETDRLLDMGFRKDIQSILNHCARPEKRQVLLFSATIPRNMQMQSILGKESYQHVDCCTGSAVDDTENSRARTRPQRQDTNVRVEQSHVVLPSMDRYVSALIQILLEFTSSQKQNSKIVVFLPTSRTVSFFAMFLEMALDNSIPIFEMHSRKSQSARNKVSSDFRRCRRGILLTTNVSARGIDYPDVTNVVQYGAPDSKENYIHRLGRTGRAGKEGQGLLVLLPFEESFLRQRRRGRRMDGIPENERISQMLNEPVPEEMVDLLEPLQRRIASGDAKLTIGAQGAYRAFLAYYVEQKQQLGLQPIDVVENANQFAKCTGLKWIPSVSESIVSRLKLKGVPGLVVEDD